AGATPPTSPARAETGAIHPSRPGQPPDGRGLRPAVEDPARSDYPLVMPLRVGINGVGRIGRALVRHLAGRKDVALVAANGVGPGGTLARLLARASVYGPAPFPVRATSRGLAAGPCEIRLFSVADPGAIPWSEERVEIVIEATGLMARHGAASAHLRGGVE